MVSGAILRSECNIYKDHNTEIYFEKNYQNWLSVPNEICKYFFDHTIHLSCRRIVPQGKWILLTGLAEVQSRCQPIFCLTLQPWPILSPAAIVRALTPPK